MKSQWMWSDRKLSPIRKDTKICALCDCTHEDRFVALKSELWSTEQKMRRLLQCANLDLNQKDGKYTMLCKTWLYECLYRFHSNSFLCYSQPFQTAQHCRYIIIDPLHAKLRIGGFFVKIVYLVAQKRNKVPKLMEEIINIGLQFEDSEDYSPQGPELESYLQNFESVIRTLNFNMRNDEDKQIHTEISKAASNLQQMFALWENVKFYTNDEMIDMCQKFDRFRYFVNWIVLKYHEVLLSLCFFQKSFQFWQKFCFFQGR